MPRSARVAATRTPRFLARRKKPRCGLPFSPSGHRKPSWNKRVSRKKELRNDFAQNMGMLVFDWLHATSVAAALRRQQSPPRLSGPDNIESIGLCELHTS